jgi:hypothetical protein
MVITYKFIVLGHELTYFVKHETKVKGLSLSTFFFVFDKILDKLRLIGV